MLFFSMSSSMFFRPEENALLSKSLDDMGFLQTAKIHLWNEDDGTAISLQTAVVHFAVDFQLHRFFTMGAFRFDPN
jgi:hypothetical protein